MSILDRVRFLIPAAILLLVSVFIFFYDLGGAPLQDWDEGIYANISAEMVESGSWMKMTLMGEPWLEKPLLPFWLDALSFKMFGFTELALRFFSALTAIGCVLLIFGLGRRLFSWYVGFWAGLLFAASPLFLDYHMARTGDHDVLFLFWFLLAIYFFVRSWHKNGKWLIFSGIAAGFAIFTRGQLGLFAILIPFATYILFLIKARVRKERSPVEYPWWAWFGWLASWMIVGGWWHVYAYFVYGQQFIDVYIIEQFFSRIAGPLQGHSGPWWFYVQYLWDTTPFVSVAACLMVILWVCRYCAALISPKKIKRIRFTPAIMLLLVWVVLFGFALIMMETKLHWYVLGLVPALYLIAFSALKHKGAPRAFATIGIVALLVFYGYQLPHRDEIQPHAIKQVAKNLQSNELIGQSVILYNTEQWNFGRTLPSAYWYLKYVGNVEPVSIGKENLEYYLAKLEYAHWIVEKDSMSDLENYKEFDFFEKMPIDDLLLLIRN